MIRGEMYFYTGDIVKAVNESVQAFVSKYGYYPKYAMIRRDEIKDDTKCLVTLCLVAFKPTDKNCPPKHFLLYPVVNRQARTFSEERIAYEQTCRS